MPIVLPEPVMASVESDMSSPNRPNRVLVLGSENRSTLSIVRSLGRAGIEIDLGWCPPGAPVSRSRYVTRMIEISTPDEERKWISDFQLQLQKATYDLVIPSGDAELIPLVLARQELEPLAKLAIPSRQAFEITFDKRKTTSLASDLGLKVPRWVALDSPGEHLPDGFPVPCVLKPISSFALMRHVSSKRVVRHIFTQADADAALPEMLHEGPVIAQAYFAGHGVGVEILARDGELLCVFQHSRIHEAPQGSGSSYRESVPLDPVLVDATRKLVKAIGYTGVMMVEFKKKGDEWIFVEINARFWGSLPLCLAAGSDMPAALFSMMTEKQTKFNQAYRVSVRCRNLFSDISWLRQNWVADHSNPNLITVGRFRSLLDLLPLVFGRDHIDTLVFDDMNPGLQEIKQKSQKQLEQLRSRVPTGGNAIAASHSILFLCKGNICRSPFAAALAKSLWPEKTIESAGTIGPINREAPPEALAAARPFGIDLVQHRSSIATDEQLAAVDRIVVFDADQMLWLRNSHPLHASKARYLDGEVADPFSRGEVEFQTCYRQIANAFSELVPPSQYSPRISGGNSSLGIGKVAEKIVGLRQINRLRERASYRRTTRSPDRQVLCDAILPAFAQCRGDILWVGCRRYTADYPSQLEKAGARCWTMDIDPTAAMWGRTGRHITGDICEAEKLLGEKRFDAVLCNGVLGFGVDSPDDQTRCLRAIWSTLRPGGVLLLGWNTDRVNDPVLKGSAKEMFEPTDLGSLSRRLTCGNTHVYDILRRLPD